MGPAVLCPDGYRGWREVGGGCGKEEKGILKGSTTVKIRRETDCSSVGDKRRKRTRKCTRKLIKKITTV